MKKQEILYIVIGFVFMLNSMIVATAQDYRVVEIDSVEYHAAKCGFEKEYLFLENVCCSCSNYCEHDYKEFLYRIVKSDEKARDIYLTEIITRGERSYDFSLINFDNSKILFLEFVTPLYSFMYAAIKYDNKISISDVKINSAPIVVSKDGYIAGFEETIDAYYAKFKTYKMAVDEQGKLDIKELFAYTTIGTEDDSWHVSRDPFAVFWKSDILYIEGVRLNQIDKIPGYENVVSCYFKVIPQN